MIDSVLFKNCLNNRESQKTLSSREKINTKTLTISIKGTVHPKMKILSSFTHPQVVPNLYEFFLLPNTKEDILKKVCNQAVLGHY